MASDPKLRTALLVHRFGLVPTAGTLAAVGNDPYAALFAELDGRQAALIAGDGLLSSGEAYRAAYQFRQGRRAARRAMRAKQGEGRDAAKSGTAGDRPGEAMSEPKQQNLTHQIYRDEAKARFIAAFDAPLGFAERLVWFWSNHFCVSASKSVVRPLCGAFEREAIRPHIAGKFADMLMAVETHPAMLIYLDNTRSIGPNSRAGRRRAKGLNENLAREILELHTVGVDGGYTQEDVTSFAKVLTGWTIVRPKENPDRAGEFDFKSHFHEPGAQRVMRQVFRMKGVEQGRAVLMMLARHPSTATHIARKLARHFIADDPSPQLVDRLARRFLETEGDLKELSKALIAAPEAADLTRRKVRPPAEWAIGMIRATGTMPDETGFVLQTQRLLGQPLWRPPAPKGFSDDSSVWLDGIGERLDIAHQFARRDAARSDVRTIAEDAFGPLLAQDTRQTLERAESQQQALTLLLMSAEFQRR